MGNIIVREIKESLFSFDSRNNRFLIGVDQKFEYNNSTKEFMIDQDPYGEGVLKKITDVYLQLNKSVLDFNTKYQNKKINIQLSANSYVDKLLLEYISDFHEEFIYHKENPYKDKIELHFKNGILEHLYIYQNENKILVNSFTLLYEENTFYHISNKNFERHQVKKISYNNSSLKCSLTNGDIIKLKINIPNSINKLIKPILDNSFNFDIEDNI